MDVDLIIIVSFLATTLFIGLYASIGISTFKDYAVGSRRMSTWALAISLIVTIYGGGFLHSKLNGYYRQGFPMLIKDLASPLRFYLISQFIILRMKEFLGDYSIAQSMGKLYGPIVRIVTAILGIIETIAKLAIQFKLGLLIITTSPIFKETHYQTYQVVVLALLVIAYSTLGGARSIVFTDIYQFLFFGVCLPILICTFLYHSQISWNNWQEAISIPQFNTFQISNKLMLHAFIWHAVVASFDPAQMQRVYMSSSIQQAAKVFSRSATIRIILTLLFFITAVALHIGGHMIPPHQKVLDYVTGLFYFPGIHGLLITTIMALLMSTADSNLHAASILFTNDLWPFLSNSTKSNQPSLLVARAASAVIGTVALLVMLYTTSDTSYYNE